MSKREGKCQLCGEIKLLTRDHIPQLSLYPKTIRASVPNLNTVSACADCNNAANVVDEVLKVFVGLVADAPWPDQLRDGVDATLRKNQRLARLLDENSRYELIPTKVGTNVQAKIVKLPKKQTDHLLSALERIVKALFFQHFDKVLVEEHEVSVFYPEVIHPDLHKELEDALMQGDWRSLNRNTLHYCFVHINHGDIVCVINLYENIEFCFCIRHKGWRHETLTPTKTGNVNA